MAKKIALLIGNSGFRDEALGALAAPDDDVVALRDILRAEACGFETIPMIGAGLIETQAAITDLFENRRRDDTLLIYYTGHGLRDDRGDLYLALPQTDLKRLRATALRSGFIREEMERSASARQVMILDCCHSGAVMAEGMKRTDHDDLVKTDFVDPVGYGKFVLTACSAQESAFERDGASIFTRHLVDGLRDGAAAPDKNNITIRDVYDYLSRRVPDEQSAMMPRIWASEQVRDLVIASNLNPRPVVPDDLVKLLWHTDPNLAFSGAARLIGLMEGADEQFTADITAALQQRMDQPETLSFLVAQQIMDTLVPGSQHDETGRVSQLEAEREKLRKSHAHEMAGLARQIATIEAERDAAIAASEHAEQQRVAETNELTTGIRTLKEQFDAEQRRLQDAMAEAQRGDEVKYTPSRIPFIIACISAGVAIAVSIYAFLFSSTEMSPSALQEIEEQISAKNAEALKEAHVARDQLAEELGTAKIELDQRSEESRRLQSNVAVAEKERDQAKEHVARLKHDLKNQESATAKSRSELADVKGQLAETSKELTTSLAQISVVMTERDQAKEHVARFEQDLEDAQKRAAELLQAARTSADRIFVGDAELKVEIDDLRARLEDAQIALNQLSLESHSVNGDADAAKKSRVLSNQNELTHMDIQLITAEALISLTLVGLIEPACYWKLHKSAKKDSDFDRVNNRNCLLHKALELYQGQYLLPMTGDLDLKTIDLIQKEIESTQIEIDWLDQYWRVVDLHSRGGPIVFFAQAHLHRIGIDPGPADGIMGPDTRVAVLEYQKLNGLPETGELNLRTLINLKHSTSEKIADLQEKSQIERNVDPKERGIVSQIYDQFESEFERNATGLKKGRNDHICWIAIEPDKWSAKRNNKRVQVNRGDFFLFISRSMIDYSIEISYLLGFPKKMKSNLSINDHEFYSYLSGDEFLIMDNSKAYREFTKRGAPREFEFSSISSRSTQFSDIFTRFRIEQMIQEFHYIC